MFWKVTLDVLVTSLIVGYPRRIIFSSKAANNQAYKCVDKLKKYPL